MSRKSSENAVRRRPTRFQVAAGAAVTLAIAAAVLTAVLGQTAGKDRQPRSLPLGSTATLAGVVGPPPLGPPGSEGVPVPSAKPIAPAGAPAPGETVDGITTAPSEQFVLHIHAHLTIFVRGVPRQVPYGVGIAPPLQVQPTPAGPFAGGAGFSWLHTHAPDGIIHIESPAQRTFTLGQFFDIWHEPLGRDQVGPERGRVTALFDGKRYLGDPSGIPLLAHAQIQLDVGRPLVAFQPVAFPGGL
jgi:hypothetical protein